MSDIVFVVEKEEIKSFSPICNKCKNHINGLSCKAFEVIPDSVIFGLNKHNKLLKNQKNNIIFESI
jgi:hypothetical protein